MSNMNEEGDEDRFSDAGRAQVKSSSILKASALFVIACTLVALLGWSTSATEPAEPLGEVLGDRLGDGWHAAPPELFSSEDEERFKEALKPAAEREWDGIQCVQTEASAACKNGVPDFWLFVYGPYDGMDCESLAILKNVAEWQIEAAEPWRAHCRERPDAPHLPYPTVPAHDSVEQKVVCLNRVEEEILFDSWEIAENIGFDLNRCSLQERVVPAVDMPSDAERPLCLGHSADTAVFDTLRFTLWDYFWLRGDIQAMWQYGDEDEWHELSESCSPKSRRLAPYTDNCPGTTAYQASFNATLNIEKIYNDYSHLHFHADRNTMRGLEFDPRPSFLFKYCPDPDKGNGQHYMSGWGRPYFMSGALNTGKKTENMKTWYCDKYPNAWVRIKAAFKGSINLPWNGLSSKDPTCEYELTGDRISGDRISVIGKGTGGECWIDLNLPDPAKMVQENQVKRNVCFQFNLPDSGLPGPPGPSTPPPP